MRESSLTASVNVALPVIVKGWFCGKQMMPVPAEPKGFAGRPRKLPKRFPKRESVAGNPGVAASSENGLA
jgi:hypothetical protein